MASHLDEKLKDRSAHILLVNTYQSSATSLIKAFHRLGFVNIQIAKDIHDLQERIRWTRVDFALIALNDQNAGATMKMLRDFYTKDNQRVRFGMITRSKESFLLPEAFQNGLLYAMDLAASMDTHVAEEQLNAFIEFSHECFLKGRHEAYIAARSLRNYLRGTANWPEIVRLEKAMVEAFPNDLSNVFRQAEAHFENHEFPPGRELIAELQQADPHFPKDMIEELYNRFPQASQEHAKKIGARLELKQVVVIERDSSECYVLEQALKRLDIHVARSFENYNDCWEAMKKGLSPDLLISDWVIRSGDLSPAQFFQRIRAHEDMAFMPLCLMGFRWKTEDTQLITDLNVLQIINKPLRADQAAMAIAFALEQYRRPSERRSIEQKIMQSLHEGHKSFAYHLRKMYLQSPTIETARKYYVEAIFLFHHKSFTKAKNHLVKGLEIALKNPDMRGVKVNVDKMFLLAQCMSQLNNLPAALTVLEKAQNLSPLNIRIPLAMAEIQAEMGQTKEAETAFRKAEKIDPENIQVLMTAGRLGITSNLSDAAKKEDILDEMLSLLNNQAVILINKNQLEKAFDLYEAAIDLLKNSGHPHLGTVYYNLALAYLRANKNQEAMAALAASTKFPESKVHQRAMSLLQRLHAKKSVQLPAKMEVTFQKAHSPFTYWRVSTLKPSVALIGIYRCEEAKSDGLAS